MEKHSAEYYKDAFLEENPEYVEVKVNNEATTIGAFQSVDDEEDEIWFLQCPKNFDITQLEGEKMKLPGRTHVNGQMEVVAVDLANSKQTFGYCNRKGRYALKRLPIRGNIILRNRFKANEALTEENLAAAFPESCRVPVLDHIKVRHPLLGVQYEKKINLDKSITERLRMADDNSSQVLHESRLRKSKKKSPGKKEIIKVESSDDDVVIVGETKSKKKKRKNSERSEAEKDESKHKKSKKLSKAEIADVSDDLQWIKALF